MAHPCALRRTLSLARAPRRAAVGRVKQLLQYWEAGGLVGDHEGRERWLRDSDTEGFLARLESLAAPALS